ncbi:MAG: hypothetical protein P4L22_03755 [Candidatus Babeliales bacterium]|nr:hypothetical protein [Candidatus Babeliales bacterium]
MILKQKNIFLKIIITPFILIAIAIAASKFLLCPVYKQSPVPSGQYAVGTKLFHLTDQARNESRLESGKREINIKCYYPSNNIENKTKLYPYYPEQLKSNKQSYAKTIPLPAFVYNCLLDNIYSHSEPNAPISNTREQYPIIIFLPGISSESMYESYLEDVASNGYIVVAIEPTFDTVINLAGKTIGIDEGLKKAVKNNNRDEIYKYRKNAHKVWIEDINFAIEQLKKFENDPASIFYKKLDLNNIGFLGHSHGGAVVTEFCDKNSICKAGINMDGWTKTANESKEYKSNLMFLLNEEGYDFIDEIYKNHNQQATLIKIPGSQHGAFSDGVLLKEPLHTIFKVTTKNPEEVRKVILNHVITFFDKWLK